MSTLIRVINPNSNQAVTNSMSEALDPFRMSDGPEISCITLKEGPFGIESDDDVATVEPLIAHAITSDRDAAVFVIACYSDPGLALCRETDPRPVFGIAECAMLTALARAANFGIISIAEASIARHVRHMRERSLHPMCAGDRPLDLSVAEAEAGSETFTKMVKVGTALRDHDGAESLILGCAGMAKHRAPLEQELGLPVIDPCQAAVGMALGVLQAQSET